MKSNLHNYIAYGNGRTGEIVHVDCWGPYVDARRPYDAQGRPLPWGIQGILYLPEAENKVLRNKLCAYCNKPFKSAVSAALEGKK